MKKTVVPYSSLELQALLLVAELELLVRAGTVLNTDVIIAMDNFRKIELLTYGSNNNTVREMILALRNEVGHLNKN